MSKKRRGPTEAQLRLYARLSSRGRFQGCPKDENLWRRILEKTSGKGIRPYRRPGGGWLELEEFQNVVPPLLRNYESGLALDKVAQLLGLESDSDLMRDLANAAFCRWHHQGRRSEHEPIEDRCDDPGDPYHPGEEDEWPEGIAKPEDADEVPF